jgi:hypothetical protein
MREWRFLTGRLWEVGVAESLGRRPPGSQLVMVFGTVTALLIEREANVGTHHDAGVFLDKN